MADLAYHADASGKAIEGSIDALVTGIMAGRQVRAVVSDNVGLIAYNGFSTVRVINQGRAKLIVADLPIRPATDNSANINAFALSIATIDSMGRYQRRDGLGATDTFSGQLEVRWFLDKA